MHFSIRLAISGLFLVLSTCTAVTSEELVVDEPLLDVATVQPTRQVETPLPSVTPTQASTAVPNHTPTSEPSVPPTATDLPSQSPTSPSSVTATETAASAVEFTGRYELWNPGNVSCVLLAIQAEAEAVDVELTCYNWAPEPRSGHFVKTVPLEGQTAVFETNDFVQTCQITFLFSGETVEVTQVGSWQDCGFGGAINASGSYKRVDEAPVLSCQPAACEPTPYALPAAEVKYGSESPVDTWTAVTERGYFDGNFNEEMRLRVTHTQNGTEWIADSFELTDFTDHFNSPRTVHWSKDGRYLYFTHDSYYDACARPQISTDMQQLNLATGEVIEVFGSGYWYSFSPDEQKLAYLSSGHGLVIWNIESGERTITAVDIESGPEHVYLTDLAWSEDSQSLIMIAHLSPCESQDMIRDGIVTVDANTLAQWTQILDTLEIGGIEAWPQWNMVLLILFGEPAQGWLNLETGELTAVTP